MNKLKVYRYKVIIESSERILSIGIIKNKSYTPRLNSKEVKRNIRDIIGGGGELTCNKAYENIEYCFAYAITTVGDIFNITRETDILTGRIENPKHDIYDFEIPRELDNKAVTEAIANRYARHICNSVISKFKGVGNSNIEIKDYELDK